MAFWRWFSFSQGMLIPWGSPSYPLIRPFIRLPYHSINLNRLGAHLVGVNSGAREARTMLKNKPMLKPMKCPLLPIKSGSLATSILMIPLPWSLLLGPPIVRRTQHWKSIDVHQNLLEACRILELQIVQLCGGFLKWWYPTTIGVPIENDHFWVFWGYHHLRKHPCGNVL